MKLNEIAITKSFNPDIYLVGGAVRDGLMGHPVHDEDFVVVGATPEQMEANGFTKVGADFPVFLDSKGREFALARTERKSGKGYHGFEVDYSTDVTIEEDLMRRDLTINAMAMKVTGWDGDKPILDRTLIDPHNGQHDLKTGTIRHVSEAFAEDPLRVLRTARFAARYGFSVSKDTINMMKQLVNDGELDHLVPERIWQEIEKSLKDEKVNFKVFVETLQRSNAFEKVFGNLPFQKIDWQAARITKFKSPLSRFAALLQDCKIPDVLNWGKKVKIPNEYIATYQTAKLVNDTFGQGDTLDPTVLYDTVVKSSLNKHPAMLGLIRGIISDDIYHPIKMGLKIIKATNFNDLSPEDQQNLKGPEIGDRLKELRVKKITEVI